MPICVWELNQDNMYALEAIEYSQGKKCTAIKWSFIKKKCNEKFKKLMIKKCEEITHHRLKNECDKSINEKTKNLKEVERQDAFFSLLLFSFFYLIIPLALFGSRDRIKGFFDRFYSKDNIMGKIEKSLDHSIEFINARNIIFYFILLALHFLIFSALFLFK